MNTKTKEHDSQKIEDNQDNQANLNQKLYITGQLPVMPVEKIGGKARNLGLMAVKDIPVPEFFAVTTDLFEEFMGSELERIEKKVAAVDVKSETDIKLASQEIEEMILARRFSAPDQALILAQIEKTIGKPGEVQLAIRSSAVDEDSLEASFAGQLESFLFVKTEDEIFNSIKKCFASAYNYRSLQYRLENGISIAGVRPAVLVQKMVFGEKSGVLFTGNPLSNTPEETVVNACYGIGEGLVSGLVEADMWVFDESMNVKKFVLGEKKEMMVLDESKGQGLITLDVKSELAAVPCMADASLLELATIGAKIEDYFEGIPQDIEWCEFEGRFYILQSRPVSTMSHINKQLPRTILDNSNIIESYSGVTSPLTFSFASESYGLAFEKFYGALGVPKARIEALDETFRNMLAYYNGRVYYRLNSWYTSLSLLPFYNLNRENLDLSLGVMASADIAKYQSRSIWGKLFVDYPLTLWSGVRIVTYYLFRERVVKNFIRDFNTFAGPHLHSDFEDASNFEILNLQRSFRKNLMGRWMVPLLNDFFTETFFGVLGKMIKWTGLKDVQNIQNDLLCGQGDVESVKPTLDLMSIAADLKTKPELMDVILNTSDSDLTELIFNASSGQIFELRERLEVYIKEYGYRCINELKLEETTIVDDQGFLFQMLRNYLRSDSLDMSAMHAREKKIRGAAEKNVFSRMNIITRTVFKWVLKNARERIKTREELRFIRTKVFAIMRNMMNRVGRRFEKSNMLESARDIYFLTVPEVTEIMEGRSVNQNSTRELIKIRKADSEEFLKMETPDRVFFYGDLNERNLVEIISDQDQDVADENSDPNKLQGVGCSPGEIEGEVKIILDPTDIKLDGQILVTKRTDPGWVPLFPCVSGLVIERGSVLSHSAVVAREMGIPTVVGARSATSRLQDGQKIRVNGTSGLVEILD